MNISRISTVNIFPGTEYYFRKINSSPNVELMLNFPTVDQQTEKENCPTFLFHRNVSKTKTKSVNKRLIVIITDILAFRLWKLTPATGLFV